MRVSAEVKHRRWTFQTEGLAFRNLAILAVLVVTEKECVKPAVCFEALARVGNVVGPIRAKNTIDELLRQRLALRRELGHRDTGEGAVSALQLDLGLNGCFFQNCFFSSAGIKTAQQPLSNQELVAIQVA